MRRDVASLGAAALSPVLAGLVMAGLVMAGCGQGPSGVRQPGAGEASGATSGASSVATVDPDPTMSAPRTKGTVTQMTVRGHIQQGVEAGCMILNADGGAVYLLLGGDRQIINAGGRVEVVGEPQPGLMTSCQQGIPFQVTQVNRI
jgi:hypothetical protein